MSGGFGKVICPSGNYVIWKTRKRHIKNSGSAARSKNFISKLKSILEAWVNFLIFRLAR